MKKLLIALTVAASVIIPGAVEAANECLIQPPRPGESIESTRARNRKRAAECSAGVYRNQPDRSVKRKHRYKTVIIKNNDSTNSLVYFVHGKWWQLRPGATRRHEKWTNATGVYIYMDKYANISGFQKEAVRYNYAVHNKVLANYDNTGFEVLKVKIR